MLYRYCCHPRGPSTAPSLLRRSDSAQDDSDGYCFSVKINDEFRTLLIQEPIKGAKSFNPISRECRPGRMGGKTLHSITSGRTDLG